MRPLGSGKSCVSHPGFASFLCHNRHLSHSSELKSEYRHGAWNPANDRGPGAGRPRRRTRLRSAQSAAPELGIWINHTGKGAIEVYLCGVEPVRQDRLAQGAKQRRRQTKTRCQQPRSEKRNRPVCGVHSLANLKRMQGGGWGDGQAYNPEEGKTYDVSIRLSDPNTLKVTGSVLFFSKTVTWTRAKGQLQRCDAVVPPPAAPPVTAVAPPAAPQPAATKPAATSATAATAPAASQAPAPAPA